MQSLPPHEVGQSIPRLGNLAVAQHVGQSEDAVQFDEARQLQVDLPLAQSPLAAHLHDVARRVGQDDQ